MWMNRTDWIPTNINKLVDNIVWHTWGMHTAFIMLAFCQTNLVSDCWFRVSWFGRVKKQNFKFANSFPSSTPIEVCYTLHNNWLSWCHWKTFNHVTHLKCHSFRNFTSAFGANEPIYFICASIGKNVVVVCSTMCEPVQLSIDCHRTRVNSERLVWRNESQLERAQMENGNYIVLNVWVKFFQLLPTRWIWSENSFCNMFYSVFKFT